MLMGCVGFVGILLSFSAGLSKVGPNTVARLWRDILLIHSFSATLGRKINQSISDVDENKVTHRGDLLVYNDVYVLCVNM